ncbi:MAG: cyclase family protein [Desulfobacteraceae bacterium]|nr:cyclase family protein [Desulfobacteraceae bacterium]
MQFIDLSVTLDNDKHWAPWWARNKVVRQSHTFGNFAIWLILRLTPSYLKNRLGWANDIIKLSTHGTTHLDAPWHYGPLSEGKPAKTIDRIPLEWCMNDGVVLDMTHKKDGDAISRDDLKQALVAMGYAIKPFDIVLIRTGNDKMLGTPDYFTRGAGVSADATRFLLEQGVKITGIDSWGWDIPLPTMAKQARKTGNKTLFWEAHYVGVEKEYCHLERLTGLDRLPSHGFTGCCFPLKIKSASAGPSRVVAILDP